MTAGPAVTWAAAFLAAGASVLAHASLIQRNQYTLRRYDVPVLAPGAEPLRVLHLSDLHLTPRQRRKQRWVADLAGLDPDLVIVTGDNIAHPDALEALRRTYEPLFDYPGAFVFGSNDYSGPVFKNPFRYFRADRERVYGADLPTEALRALLTGAGWVDLNNARTLLVVGGRTVELVGVDDPHWELDRYESVAGPVSAAADAHVGVTHSPEPRVLDQMVADGFQLLLAGHTHGGQVCLPGVGALVTNCGLPRQMAKGLHRWPGAGTEADVGRAVAGGAVAGGAVAWLHVSAGVGTSPTAPVRFACPPEASLLTLVARSA